MRNYSKRASILLLGAVSAVVFAGVQQISHETVAEKLSTKVDTVIQFDRGVGAGRMVKASDGQQGQIVKTYRVVKEGDKVVSRTLVREEQIEAKPAVIKIGTQGYAGVNRGTKFSTVRTMTMRASAYDPGPHSNGKWAGTTALGVRPGYGIVAVDPRTIKLGSLLFVEGYGFAYAADTGGAIKGDRIDLCMPTVAECYRFGRKKVVVHVLKAIK